MSVSCPLSRPVYLTLKICNFWQLLSPSLLLILGVSPVVCSVWFSHPLLFLSCSPALSFLFMRCLWLKWGSFFSALLWSVFSCCHLLPHTVRLLKVPTVPACFSFSLAFGSRRVHVKSWCFSWFRLYSLGSRVIWFFFFSSHWWAWTHVEIVCCFFLVYAPTYGLPYFIFLLGSLCLSESVIFTDLFFLVYRLPCRRNAAWES